MQEMQETQLRSLGQEDSLEEEMAAHSSILAQKIPRSKRLPDWASLELSPSVESCRGTGSLILSMGC